MIGHNLRGISDYDENVDIDDVVRAVEREAARLEIAGQADRAEAFRIVAKWLDA